MKSEPGADFWSSTQGWMRGSCGWGQGQPGAQADFLSNGSQWGEHRHPGLIGSKHSAEWGDTGGFPTALFLEVSSLSQGVLG